MPVANETTLLPLRPPINGNTQISALLYLTSWVRSLSITNLELADFMSTLQDPLRRLTTIQHVGLYFGHHNSFQSLPIASDIASRPSCIVDSVCDLLSCWPQLRSLALSRLINLGAGTVVAPEETCFVPELPRLMSLTLRECRLSNRQLAQMLEAAPALRRLYIHQPDLLVFKRAAFMESISTVQKQLETLHLSAISEAFAKDIVLTGWWPEVKDLAISAINLESVPLYHLMDHCAWMTHMKLARSAVERPSLKTCRRMCRHCAYSTTARSKSPRRS